MPKFRKKPVVIEAMQYTGRNAGEIQEWTGLEELSEEFTGGLEFTTSEGTMRAAVGDWVCRGVNGSLYTCTPENFASSFEPVAE